MTDDGKSLRFRGGPHIAMKIPPHQYEETVAFYRDTLGLKILEQGDTTTGVEFGGIELWLDRVPTASQAEIWLEVEATDTDQAAEHLAQKKVARCDGIEPLPQDYDGLWINNPAGIIHLVTGPGSQTSSSLTPT